MALLIVRTSSVFSFRHFDVKYMSTKTQNGKHFFKTRQSKSKNTRNSEKVINQKFKALNTINLSVYNIVPGLSSKVEAIFGKVKVALKPLIVDLHNSLFKYLVMNNTLTFQILRSLSNELSMKDATKVHILNGFAKRYVEKSLLLAMYYVENINTKISSAEYRHMETTTFGNRKYPLLMLKFISLLGFNKRVQRFGENSSFIEIDRSEFVYPATRKVKGVDEEFKLIEDDQSFIIDLENLVNASELVDSNLLQTIDLCSDFPVYENLLSCIPVSGKGRRGVFHSTNVPTEFELCESILLGISYSITDIPDHLIGSIFYDVPENFNQLLGIRYWENLLGGKAIRVESKLASSAPEFDSGTYKELANRPSSISTIVKDTTSVITEPKIDDKANIIKEADKQIE